MTSNLKTAQLLKRVAAVFRVIEGDTFRYKAYVNAAIAIENLTEPIEELWKNEELSSIPGIGEKLQQYIVEFLKKGEVRHFRAILKKVPAGMFPLMEIRGIGPITAYKIAKKFKLQNESTAKIELSKLIENNRLLEIEGFKEKTVARIKRSLLSKSSSKGRMLISSALPITDDFLAYLRSSPDILNAEPLGSLRRHLVTVGDIDIGVCAKRAAEAMSYISKYPLIASVITKGESVIRVKLRSGLEVDLKLATQENWGSLLQHYTGSKLHNIKLRSIAKQSGLSLSEYGIASKNSVENFRSEKEFYKFLNMQYIPPEIREGEDEIELAQKNLIPKLIELSDIKGDLHIHSDYVFPSSHDLGESKLASVLDVASAKNYEYLGISDHNPKFLGLSEKQKEKIIDERKRYLLQEFHAYENNVKNRAIKLLIGMEVDIRPDGSLALSEKLLNKLDYAIVSIHTSFEQTHEANTRRIINALSHPVASILGHPTGQMVSDRDQISADWEKIFKFCKQSNKIIEINSSPQRADLPHDLIKKAIAIGARLVINTDSHEASQLDSMKYGVWQARRAMACKKNIVNTLNYKDLHSVLKLSQH